MCIVLPPALRARDRILYRTPSSVDSSPSCRRAINRCMVQTNDGNASAPCLRVLVFGAVKSGTSSFTAALLSRQAGAVHGPVRGPWNFQAASRRHEVLFCTPHCPGQWAAPHKHIIRPGTSRCQLCQRHGLNESAVHINTFAAHVETCQQMSCWKAGFWSYFDPLQTASGIPSIAKNPEAIFWPHVCAVRRPRLTCRSLLCVLAQCSCVDRAMLVCA